MSKLLKSSRWRASGLSATLAPPRSRVVLLVLAAIWNFVLPRVMYTLAPAWTSTFGMVVATLFLLFALREWFFRSRFAFHGGVFTFSKGPLSFTKEVRVPLSEIRNFRVLQQSPEPSQIQLALRDGSVRVLDPQLDSFILYLRGLEQVPIAGVAKVEDHQALTAWLNETLDQAMHEGGGYRIAPGQVASPREMPEEPTTAKGEPVAAKASK